MVPSKTAEKNDFSLIMFDLDGTLAESKAALDVEMASLLCGLLEKTKVAVISGASFKQFQKQFLDHLTCAHSHLENLLILPTVGSSFYHFENNAWSVVYEKNLTTEEKLHIITSLKTAIEKSAAAGIMMPTNIHGEQIEDRGSEITFSANGQEAPVSEKILWDPDHMKREAIVHELRPLLPDFELEIGGMTSIDITRKGIDKEYGINEALKYLGLAKDVVLYIGDALFEGGNDYGAVKFGVKTFAVKDVGETKEFVRKYLNS